MSDYENSRDALSAALTPVVAYCQRAHESLDATDPQQSGRWRHVNQLDELTRAIVNYGEVAEKAQEALKAGYVGSTRIQAFCARVQASAAQIAASYPFGHPALRGLITSYCLPTPTLAPLPSDGQPL